MAKKTTISYNDIPNFDEDWQNDSRNGKPYSGESVQRFLKSEIKSRVKGLKLNGNEVLRDNEGNVTLNIDEVNVDESLDVTSTNAVSNATVSKSINELEDKAVAGMDWEENDDGTTGHLSLVNKTNQTIASIDLPLGGSGDVSVSRISIKANVDNARVKEGGSAILTYTYDHVNGEGASDGVKASLEITISRGTTVTYKETIPEVAAGTTGTLDISLYLLAGTVDVYVKATAITADGTQQTRQAYTSVNVITLNLTSGFNIADALTKGGYSNETIEIPFTIVGSGTKVVTLYIDGVQTSSKTITRAGTTNESFSIESSSYSAGKHNIQIVAEREGLLSDSIYMDFLIAGSSVPFIGTKLTFTDGRIYTTNLTPTISSQQYEQMSFVFAAWNKDNITTNVSVKIGDNVVATMSVNRQLQTYTNRFNQNGTVSMALVSGKTTYPFNVSVKNSTIDITEITSNLQVKLSASGRSNGEANPANWGGITSFYGLDWNTSGWTGDTLRLRNGAKAVVGYKPFATDAKATGLTVEIEFKLSNVMDRAANVISCMNGGRGFNITAEEAQFYTGNTKTITDADGGEHQRPVGVAMTFAPDLLLKVAFVLHTNSTAHIDKGNSLMELYINGVRSKVDQYGGSDYFLQSTPQDITIDSAFADVEVRSIRIYNRALSEEEEFTNYAVDRPTGEEMMKIYTANDVLGEDGTISADKLRAKGKAVCIIIPQSQIDAANAENNKKTDFTASKVYWYSPYGSDYDFVAENIYFRIQGTSSTKYPRKNYRLYLKKGPNDAANTKLMVGGREVSGKKYAMRPNGLAKELFCLKADYSDSSMVMNTGGAKLFDTVMKELDLLTPPQKHQKDNGQTITVRQAIDGIPCDLFVASEDGGELTYYGQYNFNNEKSKSGDLFGMEKVDGYTPECPIALEGLNNANEFCLFQAKGSQNSTELEAQLQASFDKGFEFNYPEDTFYSQASISNAEKESVANSKQKTAIKRWMGWIYDCIPTAMRTAPDYNDISKWKSSKFATEAKNYFDLQHLLTYYLFTDYWASVDQRAKNILWRTWDGNKWYATFYDGDTAMSIRNDGFMAYLYDITRDSYDDEANKYAFEGHDSVLWCLMLANMETELQTAANNLRGKLTTEKMLQMFNVEQQGNWSERQYNQSGRFKYMQPQIEGVIKKNDAGNPERVYYNYLYALTGNREAHRTAFLTDRGSLLDARYATSTFQSDRITLYASRKSSDAENTVTIQSGDLYYFGYRTNNGVFLDGPKRAEKDATIDLSFMGDMALNDPLNLCGASRIVVLDWRKGPSLGGNFELQACKMLRELNISNEFGSQMQTSLRLNGLSTCLQLENVNITGQTGISSDGGTSLDLSAQSKLLTLKAGGTGLTSVTLAEGAPITTLILPASLNSLRLRYLPKLADNGLTVQGYDNVTLFNFVACPNLNWQTILARCTNVKYIRVEGIKGRVDATTLQKYKGYKGIDAAGNVTDNCRLVGSVMLTGVLDDDVLAELQSHYPELTINNADYTDYVEDDNEIDSQNITNYDNKTGYEFGGYYEPSGHIVKIHNKSIPVKGLFNSSTSKMTLTPISETNYKQLSDGSVFDPSDTIGEGYDIFMYIPNFFYKGINDYKNQKKHTLLSANMVAPANSWTEKNEGKLSELIYSDMHGISIANANIGSTFADTMLVTLGSCAVYRLDVEGMKQVRYPGLKHASYGSVFVDENGIILQTDVLNIVAADGTGDVDYEDGDYIFREVPGGAKYIYFTTLRTLSDEDHPTFAVDTDDIEAIEPGWVKHNSELIGIYGASIDSIGMIRSLSGKKTRTGTGISETSENWKYNRTTGKPTNAIPPTDLNYTYQDFFNLCYMRGEGYHDVSYEQNKIIAILSRCWCGDRDDQAVYGRGTSAQYTTGALDNRGKRDTTSNSGINKIWGLEGWVACNWEVMDYVGVNIDSFMQWHKKSRPQSGGVNAIWHIYDPNTDTERTVQGLSKSGFCIARLKHGRYCDIIASSCNSDSSKWNTCYAAVNYYSSAGGRVVGRALNFALAYGGCVFANAFNASTLSSTSVGARLAFNGQFENESAVDTEIA